MSNSVKIVNTQNPIDSTRLEPINKSEQNLQTSPIIPKAIEDSVEIISEKLEEEKVSNKKAIAVGSSVLLLSTFVAVLNPKNSKRLTSKLNQWKNNIAIKVEQNRTKNTISGKIQRGIAESIDWTIRTLQFSNNINSVKDIYFKYLCTEKKNFLNIRNKTNRKFLQKLDGGFRKIMTKPYNAITKVFDDIGKHTVKSKYKSVSKKMDNIETLLSKYKEKLNPTEKAIFESKLAEIKNIRCHYTEENILKRLSEQEKLMENIETDFLYKFRQYRNGFGNKWVDKGTHISKNMTFWAEEILMPTRNKIESNGTEVINKLFGDKLNRKIGLYDDLFHMVGKHINNEEKSSLKKLLESTENKLKKANQSECVDYFDKKRDLILGSAPTDVVTAIGGLGFSGVLIATADTKEEKISNALTGAFPVIAGLGASMAFTAMLFSGVKGMIYGALASIGLSKLGSIIDKKVLGHDIDKKTTKNNSEVKNA